MKNFVILIGAVLLAAILLLFSLAPDILSLTILGVMALVLALGFTLGIVPVVLFTAGFRRALKTVHEAVKVQTADASLVVLRETELFRQKALDETFQEYKDIVLRQQKAGEVMRDVSEFISEDFLAVHSWQSLMVQIPGILTGLGILGTFIGLLTGIGTLTFTSVDATIESIALLITGIKAAFFTSVSGVILSILFNILYRILWNSLIREHGLFVEFYHKQVIPPTDVQMRHELHTGIRDLFRRMDQLPKTAGFSAARIGSGTRSGDGSEQLLMPQIVQAMREGQFVFYLQPIVTLKTRKLIGAEALVRWKHEALGVLSPAAFLPILETNGYIAKLDLYVWEQVCGTLRRWLDGGFRPLPVTLNVSRTDLLALELPEVFSGLLKKYQLPPRLLELDIAADTCTEANDVTNDALDALRALGLKVTLDGFDGDFLAFRDTSRITADGLKLDLRCLASGEKENTLEDCFAQARTLGIEIAASGIETAEQLSKLEALGCASGQGYYFYYPMPVEDYEEMNGYQVQSL